MGETLGMVLAAVILIGFAVGIIAYKPVRNKLIREKGYDADESGKLLSMFAMIAIIGGCMAGTSGDRANVGLIALGFAVGIGLQVFNVIRRAKAVGMGNAVLITLLQMLSMLWICIVWVVKMVWGMVNGSSGRDVAVSTKKEQVRRDPRLKEDLLQTPEAQAAKLEGHSDDEAAAIAAVKRDGK